MKNKLLILSAAFFTALTSCKKENSQTVITDNNSDTPEVVDGHNSQNSVDWAGTYSGTLPCASCPGINTHITLNADGTFEKSEEYLEEKDGVFDTKGTFEWSADGSSVTLDEQVYRVGENELIMLDADGNVVEGDLAENYILKKSETGSSK